MRRLLLALGVLAWCLSASSQTVFPGLEKWIVASFPSGATTVTVDVYDLSTGVQVANDQAASQISLDAAVTSSWRFDLSTIAGYPATCTLTQYLVRWAPDSADCSAAGTPSACADALVTVGGPDCEGDPGLQESTVYAQTIAAAQGITREVYEWHRRRGLMPVKWREQRRSASRDFANPDATVWQVYFYSQGGEFPHLDCVVETTSDPSVALPSTASCTGAP